MWESTSATVNTWTSFFFLWGGLLALLCPSYEPIFISSSFPTSPFFAPPLPPQLARTPLLLFSLIPFPHLSSTLFFLFRSSFFVLHHTFQHGTTGLCFRPEHLSLSPRRNHHSLFPCRYFLFSTNTNPFNDDYLNYQNNNNSQLKT